MIDLIYCAGANRELDLIAKEEGFLLGVRSDRPSYFPVDFVDIDYKQPDFEKHMARVAKEQPKYATVPDLSDKLTTEADIERVIEQAEMLQDYCETVLVVPKLPGQIALLPANIAIGYSVPTPYGGAQYPAWELAGRRVHLLGGSPKAQLTTYLQIAGTCEVMSADGSSSKKAAAYGDYWDGRKWQQNPNTDKGHYAESWRLSCRNIIKMWSKELCTKSA